MSTERRSREVTDLPEWAKRIHQEYGSPELETIQDIFLGPLIKRKSGLRKDDLIEILLDGRALPKDSDPYIRGMLVGTSRNVIEILDENGDFRSIARDVIVELRLITHLRKPYIEDRELLTFEKEDMRRRSNLHEAAERQADGRDDNHVWD
ncbi:TPA: hypothetical protein HA324_05640 [Candidatus Thalassarchaeaceae archaeon]|jgi:hypothetical protein|nr:hypothetical protein [Euryarchaeota archaeon]MDG1548285.1 hypothetical protein [Candidatus Thalassarchaeaceae archaeon]DAC65859.1 MAG TPA: hypothetical protein D7I14_05615 [Candidatus Poseidoniales archaeon]MDB4819366.1 hypothetical protein [Euryarchaeota archaeon]MDC0502161.1 hypothetical protein [Euryarchaeota archaeon]|tara:strand:- start:3098 stop:3550 length:453 start_codon:yes stop_codon:yes gene_type:complete